MTESSVKPRPESRGMLRAFLLSLLALAVPVAGAFWFPAELADYEALTWLLALIPAFLLAYQRGWRGVALALAMGMAAISVTYALAQAFGSQVPSLLFGVVIAYLVISLCIGLLADRLSHGAAEAATDEGVVDALTGLPNRDHAERFLEREFAAAAQGRPLAVVVLDLDHFREFNARNGRAAGNGVLRAFATILRQNSRRTNLAARWGPEEFLCVLSGSGEEGAVVFAERVQDRMRAAGTMASLPTASAGVASYRPDMVEPGQLVAAAEAALAQAKQNGRDRVRVHGVGTPIANLPVAAAQPAVEGTGAGPARPTPASPRKAYIYHADDELRKRLTAELGQRGMQVTEGDSLAGRLLPLEAEYDLVVLEIATPYATVGDVVREVRSRSPATRIVGVPRIEGKNVPAALLAVPLDGYYLRGENGDAFVPPVHALLADRDRLHETTLHARNLSEELRARDRDTRLALAASEEKYRALVDTAQEVILQTDAQGVLTFVNVAWTVISGHPIEDSIGTTLLEYIHADGRERLGAELAELMSDRRPYIMLETRLLSRSGESRWIEGRLQPVKTAADEITGAAGRLFDITARRTAEEALRRSEARFRALTESAADVMAVLDASGTVRYISPSVERVLGFGATERVGRSALDLIHPEDADQARAVLARVAATPGGDVTAEVRSIHRNGAWRILEMTVRNLLDVPGVEGLVVNARDVTDRRAAERSLGEAEDMLLRALRLDTIGRLAGLLAHDFNNLLTAIQGHADLVLTELGPVDPRRADLLAIEDAARRAGSLTRQFLAFGRRQVAQPEVLDLDLLVTDMRKILLRLLGEEIELVFEPRADPATIHADAGQIEQMVLNLVVNAREALPEGGRITIATSNAHVTEEPAGSQGPAPGDYVVLSVTDSGAGLEPEAIQHLFDPFSTLRGHATGTGLGLSTVYGSVRQMGGDVVVESRTAASADERGAGTTFTLYLPRGDVVPEQTATAPRPTRRGTETIALAEDDREVRELAERILVRAGYHVLAAANGRQALNAIARHQGRVDLLLADVVMPEMNGRDLADRVTAMRPGVRILFMSGHVEDLVGHHGVFAAGTAYLEKPFPPDLLLRKVRELLDTPSGA